MKANVGLLAKDNASNIIVAAIRDRFLSHKQSNVNYFILCNFKVFHFEKNALTESESTAADHNGQIRFNLAQRKSAIKILVFRETFWKILFSSRQFPISPVSIFKKCHLPVSTQTIVAFNRPSKFATGFVSSFHALLLKSFIEIFTQRN